MQLSSFINRPVVILAHLSTDEVDEAGDAIDEEVSIETVAYLEPKSADEPTGHADISVSDWVGFFFPADIEHLTSASVIWAPALGEYEVVGKPGTFSDPTTQQGAVYVLADLRQVAGPADAGS